MIFYRFSDKITKGKLQIELRALRQEARRNDSHGVNEQKEECKSFDCIGYRLDDVKLILYLPMMLILKLYKMILSNPDSLSVLLIYFISLPGAEAIRLPSPDDLQHLENLRHLEHLHHLQHLQHLVYLQPLFHWLRPYLQDLYAWFKTHLQPKHVAYGCFVLIILIISVICYS